MKIELKNVIEKERVGSWKAKIFKAMDSSDGNTQWMGGSTKEDVKMIKDSHGSTLVMAHHPITRASTLCCAIGNNVAMRRPGQKRVTFKVGSHVVGGSKKKSFYALLFKQTSEAEDFIDKWNASVQQFEESKLSGDDENKAIGANCDSDTVDYFEQSQQVDWITSSVKNGSKKFKSDLGDLEEDA